MIPFYQLMKEAREASPYPRLTDFAERIGMSISGYKKLETSDRLPSKEGLEHIIQAGQLDRKRGDELLRAWQEAMSVRYGLTLVGKRPEVEPLAAKIENEVRMLLKQCRTPVQQVPFQVFSKRLRLILRAVLED